MSSKEICPTLHEKDPKFTYEKYVDSESRTNFAKFDRTSFSNEEIRFISSHFLSSRKVDKIFNENFLGLCQGVRNGAEVRIFRKKISSNIIGTDISPSILAVTNGVLMDFHDCPKLWSGRVNFLYSNSWDHSYNLEKCLFHWNSLLAADGYIYLQHTPNHYADAGYTAPELADLLVGCGFEVMEIKSISKDSIVHLPAKIVPKIIGKLLNISLPMLSPMDETFVLAARQAQVTKPDDRNKAQ
ncbi:MAG: hypothetical protein F6J87_01445 [Spirulina sp. SIO3F2]|nr:hypothetical protein [Spirulina sp. SIO3F2]